MVYLKDFIYKFEGESFDLIVAASDGVFNSTTNIRITMSGLSILEIVVIVVAILVQLAIIVTVLCCCKVCLHTRSSRYFIICRY